MLLDVSNHLRKGADGIESFCSKVFVSGENLLSLGEHAESQSEAFTIHSAMSKYGLPANLAPYHRVSYIFS